jgi:predicted P-loop ATPase
VNLAITVGTGLDRPRGQYVRVEPPPVESLAQLLGNHPPAEEAWWSPHLWKDNQRKATGWQASSGIAVDIDYEESRAPEQVHREAIEELAREGVMPGSFFHLTPHGARVVAVFNAPCSDKKAVLAAAISFAAIVADTVAGTGYKVDEACHKDLARLYFTPNSIAKGVARRADVIVMRARPFAIAELIAEAAEKKQTPRPPRFASGFDEAAERWNADHRQDFPKRPATCPACGHNGCFHALPADESRWFCFSANHTAPGIKRDEGYTGDALDLEAYQRGCKPIDVLVKDGYLEPRRTPPPKERVTADGTPPPQPEPNQNQERKLRSNSYLTAVLIVEDNRRDILDGKNLELNEMTGRVELGGRPIRDEDVSTIRAEIERRFDGGLDKQGDAVGLRLSITDVHQACQEVAYRRGYHPVRRYLEKLRWDGVERLDTVAEDYLGADGSALNRAIMRRFFVSAVARAMRPGCKVDTMLILVGKQGALKSTFFKELASESWFVDSPIDLARKDAYEQLRSGWIIEWAELESLFRARDANTVKSFLSSCIDTYRPSYGRSVIAVPRSCVIVGTTNQEEFLTDETGNRRFHPIRVGEISLDKLAEQRDQLWAEAAYHYRRGEPWWLSQEEGEALDAAHEEHRVRDAWEDKIIDWALSHITPFTTGEVLEKALEKPSGQWSRGDEMRISRTLRAAGWSRKTDPENVKTKKWFKK